MKRCCLRMQGNRTQTASGVELSSALPVPLPCSGSRITPFKSPTSLLVIFGADSLGDQLCSGWSWALLGTQNLAF